MTSSDETSAPPVADNADAGTGGADAHGEAEIVVVVPVFRHSVFLADAVDSACAQETEREYRIVIVDDGCPHSETQRVAMALAAMNPGLVDYVRTENRGLSAARNMGVTYALHRWPSTRALYFLDADNMIEPHALERAWNVLMSDPRIGWAYPDICMFGSTDQYFDFSGPYSILRHLVTNVSEAASMVRREVFDRGCRFDEAMRLGYEDWEFWWRCLEAGFVGKHVPFFGLRYRKRPESMLSDTNQEKDSVLSYMRRRHPRLFRAKSLLSHQAAEAPRFAILHDDGRIKVCSDVRESGEFIEPDEFIWRVVAANQEPFLYSAPSLFVSASAASLDLLRRSRLDRFALWWLERQASSEVGAQVAAIEIEIAPPGAGIAIREMDLHYWPVTRNGVHLIAVSRPSLKTCVEDASDDWAQSLMTATPLSPAPVLRLQISEDLCKKERCPDALHGWVELFRRLQAATSIRAPRFPVAKPRSIPSLQELPEIPRALLECGALLSTPPGRGRDIAFVLSELCSGEVERLALAMAASFRARAWRCHLLVLADQARLTDQWLSEFDSVLFYRDETVYLSPQSEQFLGSPYPARGEKGENSAIEGLLLPMDAVINFHSATLHKHLAKLRRSGVATAAALLFQDATRFGRECGHPAQSLGYEHVYDIIATGSVELSDWCHALGAPEDKLVTIPAMEGDALTFEAPTGDPTFRDLIDRFDMLVSKARGPDSHDSQAASDVAPPLAS